MSIMSFYFINPADVDDSDSGRAGDQTTQSNTNQPNTGGAKPVRSLVITPREKQTLNNSQLLAYLVLMNLLYYLEILYYLKILLGNTTAPCRESPTTPV